LLEPPRSDLVDEHTHRKAIDEGLWPSFPLTRLSVSIEGTAKLAVRFVAVYGQDRTKS